ncbi:CHAP domain-containing protein [Rathayibacter sp. VKM Ac-2805]|uniref:CHAP domain-containing protein n=1 Tax=Rathayibacter sp. VKM Ac-2805 TaxID=2609258 RepID=UPI001320290F|nr:CHAP domain-containing protein [Rathayibacter sp. VKM Ac-2805]QHC73773.1 hypothetical protein GSU40_08850 [Rathayibacter sp. VKM Ac-2805]
MTLEQFLAGYPIGGSYGNPGTGTYRGQCVSYVRLYMEAVLGIKTAVWGNAVDYWSNPAVLAHFDRVPAGQERDGDIPVWGDDPGSWTGPEGHIGIRYNGRLLNQNYGGSLRVSINTMFAPGLLGFLRVKGEEMIKPSEAQVRDAFSRYADAVPNKDQVPYYVGNDVRQLQGDILGTTVPSADEVKDAFARLAPWADDKAALGYYTGKPKWLLYKNLAGALRDKLDEAQNAQSGAGADKKLAAIKAALDIK